MREQEGPVPSTYWSARYGRWPAGAMANTWIV